MKQYKNTPLVVEDLFDKETHNVIVQYLNDYVPMLPLLEDVGIPEESQRFKRRYALDLPFFSIIHEQLTEYACDIFGVEVKPSYSFLSMYEDGGQCPLHLDRPQCRYTIDYLIRQDSAEPWPINIGPQMTDEERDSTTLKRPISKEDIASVIDSTDWTTCMLKPNDATCYSGTNAWHYRPTRSVGTADLVFFHFVPKDFNGPLN